MINLHDYYCGKMFNAYDYFGAHPCYKDGRAGIIFRVYAPAANHVELIGNFNQWKGESMCPEGTGGVYTCFSDHAGPGMLYRYRIYHADGTFVDKSDPYGFGMELRPNSASVVVDLSTFKFSDEAWMKSRNKNYNLPMNIYEVHLGSFKRNDNDENGWYTYSEMAEQLVRYCKDNYFTHIELMPVSEYPADCSWGYQVSGFYAPTKRYGEAKDLMYFIDYCHNHGIGVIVDFVPVHFAIDEYGLCQFDGNALYEYPNKDTGLSEWGSYSFNYYRGEVCSFLQSAANYWLTKYHVDGIRMDAISNVIYWRGDTSKGVNEGGIKFLKTMNEGLKKLHPCAMLIAEDSSAFEKVTAPTEYGGLGFDYKWDMGWMNDTLQYFKTPPKERKQHHGKLLFSMHYFYNELYLLPFSHDEVVHGKATILQKMWGGYEEKFPQARTLYTYMFTRPGKKLNFMGNEIGHFREWNEEKEIDWMLLGYDKHTQFYQYFKEICRMYYEIDALHDCEYDRSRFRWLEADAREQNIFVYERIGKTSNVIVILNMSDKGYEHFTFGYDKEALFKLELNSNQRIYGGTEDEEAECLTSVSEPYKNWSYKFKVSIAKMSSKIFIN